MPMRARHWHRFETSEVQAKKADVNEASEPNRQTAGERRDLFGWDGRDLLPDVSSDETDSGWGEDRAAADSADPSDLRRFLDDKPPHHF